VSELLRLLATAAAGAAIGALYFGGLWLTVRRLPTVRRPAAFVLASFVTRTGLAALGFVVLLAGEPLRLAVALTGFLVVRMLLVRRVRPPVVTGAGGGP
jgi:F1F0 ATPase subunit 2